MACFLATSKIAATTDVRIDGLPIEHFIECELMRRQFEERIAS